MLKALVREKTTGAVEHGSTEQVKLELDPEEGVGLQRNSSLRSFQAQDLISKGLEGGAGSLCMGEAWSRCPWLEHSCRRMMSRGDGTHLKAQKSKVGTGLHQQGEASVSGVIW